MNTFYWSEEVEEKIYNLIGEYDTKIDTILNQLVGVRKYCNKDGKLEHLLIGRKEAYQETIRDLEQLLK